MRIYLTAVVKSKPEHIAEVKAILQDMVVQSRKEPACLQYILHQGSEDPALFVFHEIWENRAGLDAHNAQPYLQNFGSKAATLLQEPAALYFTDLI